MQIFTLVFVGRRKFGSAHYQCFPPTLSAAYRTTGYSQVERQRSNLDLSSHVGLTECKLPDK